VGEWQTVQETKVELLGLVNGFTPKMFSNESRRARPKRRVILSFCILVACCLGVWLSTPAAFAQSAYGTNMLGLSPVAYWRLNEATNPSTTTVMLVDATGHGYNGTYGSASTDAGNGNLGPTPPVFPGFETTNGALGTRNGVANSFATVPALNLNTNKATISMWIYPVGNQTGNASLFFWRGTDTAGLNYDQFGDNQLAFTWGSSLQPYEWQSGLVPPQNMWSMVTLVVTPTNASVYLVNTNGLSSATLAINNANEAFSGPSDIGTDAFSTARTFNGYMDEVAVFNQCLTGVQIANLYTSASDFVFSPAVTTQPVAQETYPGRNAQFTVASSGLPPFSYQWYTTNGSGVFVPVNLASATNQTLVVSNVTASTPLEYEVVVSNVFGVTTSSVTPLTVVASPTNTFAQAVVAAQPVAYWRLDETANPNPGPASAFDYYGGFTGTYGINTMNGGNGVAGPETPGWPGMETSSGALETFNGETNSYVTVPALDLFTTSFTVSMWIYPVGIQAENTGLFFWRGGSTAGFIFNGGNADNGLGYNWGGSSTPYNWDSRVLVPTNLWSFVTLVVTPTNATVYTMNTNGLQSNSFAFNNLTAAFDGPSAIGTDPYSAARTFNGIIDEVAVYNQSLTESQLNTIYIAGAGLWPGLAPSFTQPPGVQTVHSGANAEFSVEVSGLTPFAYQWYTTNGSGVFVAMTNGGGVGGVTNTNLFLTNVTAATSAEYEIVVSNVYGMVTSSVGGLSLFGAATSPYETAVLADGPLAYWRFNETQNPNPGPVAATDLSGNNFNGIYGVNTADAATGVSGPVPPAFPGFETVNGAVQTFNGQANSYVTVPALNLNTNVLTLSMWIYPFGNQATGAGLFFWRGSSTAGLIYNNFVNNNELAVNWNNSATGYNWQSGLVPPSGTWSQVTLVVTATNATIYVINNTGLNFASLDITNAVLPFDSSSTIGADPFSAGRSFNGVIDDVAVFQQAFTEAQVAALYTPASGQLQSPVITSQPAPEVLFPGRTAQYTVGVVGANPFTFQWMTTNASGNFVPMSDGGTVSGTSTATLTIGNVSTATPKKYEVVIANAIGTNTSSVATLALATSGSSAYAAAVGADQPLAYWRLNERVNPNPGPAYAFDDYGGLTGIYGTNASDGVAGPQTPALTGFETTNTALETYNDVTNSYVTVPALNLNTNTATITMWVNPVGDQAQNTGLFFWRGLNNAAGLIYGGAHPDNNLAYNWGNNSQQYLWDSGVAPPAGQWSLVSLVVTPTNATLYLMNTNGLTTATTNITNANMAFDSTSTIGTDPYSSARTFNGLIDDVAIFGQPLSQLQLIDLYLAGAGSWPVLAPNISQEPISPTLAPGRNAQFLVVASGQPTLVYQWYTTNGSGNFVPMTDGPGIFGSQTTTLVVSNVSAATPTKYEVVITNVYGSETSVVATLTVAATSLSTYAAAVEAQVPVAYWRFNDGVKPNPGPATAYDYFGGYSGTYGVNTSNAANGIAGPQAPGWPGFESTNGALETANDVTNSYVTVPPLNLNTNTVTISMWVYPQGDQTPNTGLFFWRGANSAAGFIYDGAGVNDELAYNWGNNSATYLWTSGMVPPKNIWSFVSLVVTPTNATIYMMNTNGLSLATTNITNAVMAFDSSSAIGTDTFQDARTFNGLIDEVAIFNKPLTESQLNTIYIAGAGDWPGLAPLITQQPAATTLYAGRNAQFTVAASGLTPFVYQWFSANGNGNFAPTSDGGGVAGSTNTTLLVSNVSISTPTQYEVVISNFYGVVTSSVANLSIAGAPTSGYATAMGVFSPLAYWRFNETVNPNPGPAFAYDYFGGFAGTYGVNSSNAADGVFGPSSPTFPGFEANNGALETVNGDTNSFVTVPALNLNTNLLSISMWIYPEGNQTPNTGLFFWRGSSTGGFIYTGGASDNDLAYNWGNSTGPFLWDSHLSPPTNTWSFVTLEVTSSNATIYMLNTNGRASASLAISNAPLAFDGPSAIGTDPYSDTRTFNGIIDEVSIAGQLISLDQLNSLYVTAAGPWVQFEPIITAQPAPATLYPGRTAQFTVAVTGLAPFSYQWLTTNGSGNFVPLAAQTNATLGLTNVSSSTPSLYEAVITNAYGSATSSVVTLTVTSASLSTYGTALQTNNPVAFWQLNETAVNPATGTAPAYDFDGGFTGFYGTNAFNGGSPGTNAVAGPSAPSFPGFPMNNTAVRTFNGSNNSYVTVPALNLNTNTITCAMWINPTGAQLQGTGLFFCRGGTTVSGFGYGAVTPNDLGFTWNNVSTTYEWDSGISAPSNTWSMVAWVITPTNTTVYLINGSGFSSATLNFPNQVEAFDAASTIGADPLLAARTFNGSIADVALFNQALTVQGISALYTTGSGQTFPPQVTQSPTAATIYAGRTAQFTGSVASGTAFSYEWLTTNGSGGFLPMSGGAGAPGAATVTLYLTNVSTATPAQYALSVSNLYGAVTSGVASLTVLTPGTLSAYETAVAAAGPLVFWKLNETNANPASGTALAYDYYGGFAGVYGVNSFDGGSPSPFTVAGPERPAFTGFGTNEGALETVEGVTNSYVTIPALELETNVVTCTMWINPTGAQAKGTGLFFCRGGSTVSGFGYGAVTSNNLGFTWGNSPASYGWDSGLSAPSNIWSMVSWVITSSNATIYVINTNGVASASELVANAIQAFDAPSAIGSDTLADTRTFNGEIANVALFNQVLSQSQLSALYGAGLNSTALPLPTITWQTPAGITYPTALSATQLDATASVAGTFVYNPPLGTIVNAGNQTLSVTFTPTDTADYNSGSQTVNLAVAPATVSVTLGLRIQNKVYDQTTNATLISNNVVLSGVRSGDVASLNTNGYLVGFATGGVGNGLAVAVSGLTLSGSSAGNYLLTQPAGLTANITAATVTIVSGVAGSPKFYDRTTTATLNSNDVVLGGVLPGDAVRLNTNGYVANFVSAAVGNGVAITVSGMSLSGLSSGNYVLTQPTGLAANIVALPVTITSGILINNKAYDGTMTATLSSNNVVLAGVLNGDTVNLHTNGYAAGFVSAGVGTGIGVAVSGLSLSGASAGNYALTQPTGLTANITTATVTIASGITANNKQYDRTTTATLNSNNVVLAGVVSGDTATLNTNGYVANFVNATAGNGVAVTVSGLTLGGSSAANYALTQPTGLTASITTVTLTIASGITANNKQYDRTTTANLSSNNVTLSGVINGDTVTISTNGYAANFTGAAAASGIAVNVSGLNLAGSSAGNYALTQPAGLTANITTAPVTIVSGIAVNNKAYDRTTTATLSSNNVVLSGVVNGDTLTISTNGYAANFISASAGNGIAVNVSGLTLSGSSAGNYTLTQPAGLTANITAAPVTIASGIAVNNKAYDRTTTATLSSNNVVLSGVVNGDTVSLNTNGYAANFASPTVGTGIGVMVSGLTLGGSSSGNYALTQPTGLTANIAAVTVTIASGITANNKQYDRTATVTLSSNNMVLSGVVNGDALIISTNGYIANFTSASAGNGIAVNVSGLTLSGSSAGNYALTQPAGLTANITVAPVGIISGITVNNKSYDRTTTATLSSNNVVLSGVVNGDTLTISTNGYVANFTSLSAGNGIAANVSGLTLSGSSAGNYALTQPVGLTANITAATVTIALGITANNKQYNRATPATLNSNNVVLAGVVSGDTVSLNTNGYVANFVSATVGNGVAVTVSGLTLGGSSSGNYALTQPTSLTANITTVTVTIVSGITVNNKVFDRTTTATLSSNNVVISGVLSGDTASLNTNGYVANFASATVGSNIVVSVSGLTMSGATAGDYSLTQPTGLTANISSPSLQFFGGFPNLIILWTTNATDYVLEQTASLTKPVSWTPVTNPVTISGTNNSVTINASGAVQFYQLIGTP
jgi:Concanavalin A-like lectin/glucanases superfamily/YDG domain/Immunoglobulin I-set domain